MWPWTQQSKLTLHIAIQYFHWTHWFILFHHQAESGACSTLTEATHISARHTCHFLSPTYMTTYLLFVVAEEAIQEVEGEEERPLALNVLKLHQLRGLVVQSVWVLQNKTSYSDGLNTYTHTHGSSKLCQQLTLNYRMSSWQGFNTYMNWQCWESELSRINDFPVAVLREWTFKDIWLPCSSAERVNFQGCMTSL